MRVQNLQLAETCIAMTMMETAPPEKLTPGTEGIDQREDVIVRDGRVYCVVSQPIPEWRHYRSSRFDHWAAERSTTFGIRCLGEMREVGGGTPGICFTTSLRSRGCSGASSGFRCVPGRFVGRPPGECTNSKITIRIPRAPRWDFIV